MQVFSLSKHLSNKYRFDKVLGCADWFLYDGNIGR